MIRKCSFLVLALVALTGCASDLDAASTEQNAKNVRTLVAHVAELHVVANSDPAIVAADAETGASAIRLADEMAKAAAK